MNSELDDLFRQQLDGHATPPPADLWARLQARTAAEGPPPADADPVDARFRVGLAGHATPPRRELWERLEDEHLRPRTRRRPVVAWGRLAVAASLLLLVLAGGTGLWWRARRPAVGPVATASRPAGYQPARGPRATVARAAPGTVDTQSAVATTAATTAAPGAAVAAATRHAPAAATTAPAGATSVTAQPSAAPGRPAEAALLAAATVDRQKNRKTSIPQATGLGASPSSNPVASTTAGHRATSHRPAPGYLPTTPLPDAATGAQLALGQQNTPGSQPTTQSEALALAAASPPLQVIEVEVRRGSRPAASAAPLVAAAATTTEAAEPRARRRLGGLLRQAGNALRGEPVSLAEATGLPETVTLQAHLGERVLSRTIRL